MKSKLINTVLSINYYKKSLFLLSKTININGKLIFIFIGGLSLNLINISSGHYGKSTGASDLIDEVIEARKVTNMVVKQLRIKNIGVTKIEDNCSKNQRQNLNYLISQHNKTKRKLDVSIHFNSSGKRQTSAIGTEVLFKDYSLEKTANRISKSISIASGLLNRGAKNRNQLAFLNGTEKPSIIIEICFVNSTTDVSIYKRKFSEICEAITNELIQYILYEKSK